MNLFSSGTNINKYLWSPGNYTTANIIASPSVTTTFTNIGYFYSGTTLICSDTSTATVYVIPFPQLTLSADTVICEGDSTIITGSGAQSYSWSPCFFLNSCSGSTVMATPPVTVNFTVTGYNSLASLSCVITKEILISVQACTGINELKNINEKLSAFPNPFHEKLNIIASRESEVIIYNTVGKVLIQKNFINSIDIATLNIENGIYFIFIKNKEGSKTLKLIRN